MPKMIWCTDERHGNLPCGSDGNPIAVQAEGHHWHFADEHGTAYHAACKPPSAVEATMSETRTLWNCASCARDVVAALPATLARSVAGIQEIGVPKFCLFCGKASLRPYGEITPERLFWL